MSTLCNMEGTSPDVSVGTLGETSVQECKGRRCSKCTGAVLTVVKGSDKNDLPGLVPEPGLEAQLKDLGRAQEDGDDRDVLAGKERVMGDRKGLVLGVVVRRDLVLGSTPGSVRIEVS